MFRYLFLLESEGTCKMQGSVGHSNCLIVLSDPNEEVDLILSVCRVLM